MEDNSDSIFQIFEIDAGDTYMTTGSTGTRFSLLIQYL